MIRKCLCETFLLYAVLHIMFINKLRSNVCFGSEAVSRRHKISNQFSPPKWPDFTNCPNVYKVSDIKK